MIVHQIIIQIVRETKTEIVRARAHLIVAKKPQHIKTGNSRTTIMGLANQKFQVIKIP